MSQRFIVTKEHRRFTEFADAVRRGHTIGLCFGPAGVGKTLSARRYARWDKVHDLLTYWGPRSDSDAQVYAALAKSRTVLYTPSVLTTPRTLKDELTQAITRTNMCIEQHLVPPGTATPEAWGWRVDGWSGSVFAVVSGIGPGWQPASEEDWQTMWETAPRLTLELRVNENAVSLVHVDRENACYSPSPDE